MQNVWVILLFLPSALSRKFKVVVPEAHVFSVSGSDVVLPCSVQELHSQNIMVNAADMNVTWSRPDIKDSLVHFYGNHKDLNTGQNPFYRKRTTMFKEELKNGNVSLKLFNVHPSDEGEYRCRVESSHWEDELSFKLSVEVLGSEPVITVEKYESGKFSLLCESKGWHSEPELQWRNSKGVILTAETETQPGSNLFNVKSRTTVEKIDSFFCSVTQRNHVKEGRIDAHTLYEHVPSDAWKIVGITIGVLFPLGVLAGVVFYVYNERRKTQEVTSYMKSYHKRRLQHRDLSQHQWNHVEFTLLNSEKDLKEFNLRKFDPSNRGVEKLKKVIASSKKALLEYCDLTEESCADLAEVVKSENSKLIELNLSQNKLTDSGVKKLCDGLKEKNCKLEILRLYFCYLTEESCADLAKVLKSENSKLKELNLSQNRRLTDSGLKKLCDGLKDKNCKLQILRLENCDLKEESCEYLTSVLKSGNSKLRELYLSNNALRDLGVKNLCDGLKDEHCKLEILGLEDCFLTEKSCADLASVLKSENSKLKELNLSENTELKDSKDSGVEKLCDGLKDKNCKLQILRLEYCGLTEKSCEHLAKVLKSENSKLTELNLSQNRRLTDSGLKHLCDGLKNEHCKLQILGLENCGLTEESCADLASVLKSEKSKLIELNLNKNKIHDQGFSFFTEGLHSENCKLEILRLKSCGLSEGTCLYLADILSLENSKLRELNLSQNKLEEIYYFCDGLKNKNCKLQKLWLEDCDITPKNYADLASVLSSENSKLIELNLSKNKPNLFFLCNGLKDENCKLKTLRLADCGITYDGFTVLASFLIENPSSPLKELDLSGNQSEQAEQSLFSKLKDTLPDLNVIF